MTDLQSHPSMKDYYKNKTTCRRGTLLSHFEQQYTVDTEIWRNISTVPSSSVVLVCYVSFNQPNCSMYVLASIMSENNAKNRMKMQNKTDMRVSNRKNMLLISGYLA